MTVKTLSNRNIRNTERHLIRTRNRTRNKTRNRTRNKYRNRREIRTKRKYIKGGMEDEGDWSEEEEGDDSLSKEKRKARAKELKEKKEEKRADAEAAQKEVTAVKSQEEQLRRQIDEKTKTIARIDRRGGETDFSDEATLLRTLNIQKSSKRDKYDDVIASIVQFHIERLNRDEAVAAAALIKSEKKRTTIQGTLDAKELKIKTKLQSKRDFKKFKTQFEKKPGPTPNDDEVIKAFMKQKRSAKETMQDEKKLKELVAKSITCKEEHRRAAREWKKKEQKFQEDKEEEIQKIKAEIAALQVTLGHVESKVGEVETSLAEAEAEKKEAEQEAKEAGFTHRTIKSAQDHSRAIHLPDVVTTYALAHLDSEKLYKCNKNNYKEVFLELKLEETSIDKRVYSDYLKKKSQGGRELKIPKKKNTLSEVIQSKQETLIELDLNASYPTGLTTAELTTLMNDLFD